MPKPEVRIDLHAGAEPSALWVTAVGLPGGGEAVLHLRAGTRGDRRRRSIRRSDEGPRLLIHALGRTQVASPEHDLSTEWLGERPGQVLKYLITERSRVVMVDEIAETIWPDVGPRAINSTRYSVHRLRQKLEPIRAARAHPAFVKSQHGGYFLDRERVWLDVDDFERAIEQGRLSMSRLNSQVAAHHLERALALYRGPFLADEPYAEWATDERNRLSGMAVYAARILLALARERSDATAALRYLEVLSALEPYDGVVHREFTQALLLLGQRSGAKREYEAFAQRLRREFGLEPDFDLRSVSGAAAEATRLR